MTLCARRKIPSYLLVQFTMKLVHSSLAVLLSVGAVGAFVAPRSDISQLPVFRAAAVDAIGFLESRQAATVDAVASAIPDIATKPGDTWAPGSFTIAGCRTSLDARDAPGPANIAWISSLNVESKQSSLTIFNGPLTDVPHLLSRCVVVNENTLSFDLDFRPRAYGAYETRQPDGTYPGPEVLGRQAFEFSGARREFDTKFGNEEVVSFMEATTGSFEGGGPSTIPTTEFDQLTRGPLAISIMMPLTETNLNAIASAREKAANYWLGWALDDFHGHRPGAPVNTQYVYDSKYKLNAYSALLAFYQGIYGPEDGAKLAAADSGPLDEAYVGGGS